MMSPPASDSGSGSPPQFSPYCVDSEPGSPLLDHEQVAAKSRIQDLFIFLFVFFKFQCNSLQLLLLKGRHDALITLYWCS